MSQANLKIFFCKLLADYLNKNGGPEIKVFNEFILDEKSFPIDKNTFEKAIFFNEIEEKLGVKVCHYKLKRNNQEKIDEITVEGSFEIYKGNNIGYCFIDNKGSTFELSFLFLNDKKGFENLLNNKIAYSVQDNFILNESNVIYLQPDKLGTEDRLNLLLINCNKDAVIGLPEKNDIHIGDIIKNIENFSEDDSYQVCFHNKKDKDFAYRKIFPHESLNFADIYCKKKDEINKLYDNLNLVISKSDDKIEKTIIKKIFAGDKKDYEDLKNIIQRKFVYGQNIIEKELNKEEYIDFIFKVTFFICIYEYLEKEFSKEKQENISKEKIREIVDRLLKNKENICQDQSLKINEKIILILELWNSDIYLDDKNYEINYINLSKIDHNSPLDLALNFIKQFIDELDINSNFYYPLLLIDSGLYKFSYKENSNKKTFSIHGFNMLPLASIKSHLKMLIPTILVLSNSLDEKDEGYTNSSTGLITLNNFIFKNKGIDIGKKELNDYEARHYGFILSKYLMHELFGHEKSCYSKDELNDYYHSAISFKDKTGDIIFLSENHNKKLFLDIKEVIDDEEFPIYNGDSGFLIEYFFGKIGKNFTTNIIEKLEDKINLGFLLDTKLWHKDMSTLNEYIELRHDVWKYYNGKIQINEEANINEQIIDIKVQISKYEMIDEPKNKNTEKNFLGLKRDKIETNEENTTFGKKLKKRRKFDDEISLIESKYGKGNYTIDPKTGKIYINTNKWKYPYKK